MMDVPLNPNSVHIPLVSAGCLKVEFDSTYPIHLNGIISQYEFQESIKKINRRISSNKSLLILAILFGLSIIGGIIFFIIGGTTRINSRYKGFSVLIGVGIAFTTIGSIFFAFGCFAIQSRRIARMRQAIAEESMKYSSRSPIPCSWRLDTSRVWFQGYRYRHNNQLVYHLVIDIGRSAAPGSVLYQSNQVAPEPTSIYGRQDYYAPPPYSSTSTGFCSNCSAPKNDSSAKFCSSCGQSFNKY
ncbi:unnamed protein product [Rotaria sp. Silwood1]|nr:unnamed protein product [Rotaria sp. Silwood1]CAF3654002.1 unnamed protein product [Rotaria sp. Silwood1]CAF4619872.1 unnamed protein product [Rotaria sp. Silwood1]